MTANRFLLLAICAIFGFITPESATRKDDFKLGFICAGLGSNLNGKFPKFVVSGQHYYYTRETNSAFSPSDPIVIDSVCKGNLKITSVDAIINICKKVDDSVYKTNARIMSGCIDYLTVEFGQSKKVFTLHNASDPDAAKIIAILNSNLPAKTEKLWLFGD